MNKIYHIIINRKKNQEQIGLNSYSKNVSFIKYVYQWQIFYRCHLNFLSRYFFSVCVLPSPIGFKREVLTEKFPWSCGWPGIVKLFIKNYQYKKACKTWLKFILMHVFVNNNKTWVLFTQQRVTLLTWYLTLKFNETFKIL